MDKQRGEPGIVQVPTLAQLDAQWRDRSSEGNPGDFYAVVCEAVGPDNRAGYRHITEEIIAERARLRNSKVITAEIADEILTDDPLRSFERNFKFISNNSVLKRELARMERVRAGQALWLSVIQEMRDEWKAKKVV